MAETRALSQWEIDALLNQIPEAGGGSEPEAAATAASMAPQNERVFARVIKSYDFRRPDKFSKEQWHTLQAMHDTFSRLLSAAFSSRLRTLVGVRLSSIDQGLYEEWQSQVPSQAVCYVFSMQPLGGSIIVEFSSDVAVEAVDRLLGGNGALLDRSRELGEIELALLRSFSRAVATSVEEMWSAITPLRAELQDLGMDANLLQIANPNDVVLSAFFEVSIGSHLGALSICTPYTVLEPVAALLTSQTWRGDSHPRSDARTRRIVQAAISAAPVELNVVLGATDLPVSIVLGMQPGDTILLDNRADRPLPLFVGRTHRFFCRPGMVGSQVGVRVVEVVEDRVYDFGESDDSGAPGVVRFPGSGEGATAQKQAARRGRRGASEEAISA